MGLANLFFSVCHRDGGFLCPQWISAASPHFLPHESWMGISETRIQKSLLILNSSFLTKSRGDNTTQAAHCELHCVQNKCGVCDISAHFQLFTLQRSVSPLQGIIVIIALPASCFCGMLTMHKQHRTDTQEDTDPDLLVRQVRPDGVCPLSGVSGVSPHRHGDTKSDWTRELKNSRRIFHQQHKKFSGSIRKTWTHKERWPTSQRSNSLWRWDVSCDTVHKMSLCAVSESVGSRKPRTSVWISPICCVTYIVIYIWCTGVILWFWSNNERGVNCV